MRCGRGDRGRPSGDGYCRPSMSSQSEGDRNRRLNAALESVSRLDHALGRRGSGLVRPADGSQIALAAREVLERLDHLSDEDVLSLDRRVRGRNEYLQPWGRGGDLLRGLVADQPSTVQAAAAAGSFMVSGYTREQACRSLQSFMPWSFRLLAIRSGDWVPEVRAAALDSLKEVGPDEIASHLGLMDHLTEDPQSRSRRSTLCTGVPARDRTPASSTRSRCQADCRTAHLLCDRSCSTSCVALKTTSSRYTVRARTSTGDRRPPRPRRDGRPKRRDPAVALAARPPAGISPRCSDRVRPPARRPSGPNRRRAAERPRPARRANRRPSLQPLAPSERPRRADPGTGQIRRRSRDQATSCVAAPPISLIYLGRRCRGVRLPKVTLTLGLLPAA